MNRRSTGRKLTYAIIIMACIARTTKLSSLLAGTSLGWAKGGDNAAGGYTDMKAPRPTVFDLRVRMDVGGNVPQQDIDAVRSLPSY